MVQELFRTCPCYGYNNGRLLPFFLFWRHPLGGAEKGKGSRQVRLETRSVGPVPSNIINLTIRTHRAVTTNIKQNNE